MTLTAYAGVTSPQEIDYHSGNGTTAVASGFYTSNFVTNAGNGLFLKVLIGDRFYVTTSIKSGTATVSSPQLLDMAGGILAATWTKKASVVQGTNTYEFWEGIATATGISGEQVVYWSASGLSAGFQISQMRGVTSISAINTNSGSGTTSTAATATAPTTTAPNAYVCLVTVANTAASLTSGLGSYPIPTIASFSPFRAMSGGTPVFIYMGSQGTPVLANGLGTISNAVNPAIITATGAISWATFGYVLYGPTVQLDDLTYLCRDDGSGILLNNPLNAFPIYDIETVTGLDDNDVTNSSSSIDGAHGSYVNAKYLTGKTVVLEGTLYTTVPVPEGTVDAFKYSWRPDPSGLGVPLFFKPPTSAVPRCMYVYPSDFKADQSNLRSTGQIPFQLQAQNADARSYGVTQAYTSNTDVGGANFPRTFRVSVPSSGNIESYPKIFLTLYASEITAAGGTPGRVWTFYSNVWDGYYQTGLQSGNPLVSISLGNGTLTASVTVMIDLGLRKLYKVGSFSNGLLHYTDISGCFLDRAWFGIVPGVTNVISLRREYGVINNDGFTLTAADAFR